jgi:hypothetical protein
MLILRNKSCMRGEDENGTHWESKSKLNKKE